MEIQNDYRLGWGVGGGLFFFFFFFFFFFLGGGSLLVLFFYYLFIYLYYVSHLCFFKYNVLAPESKNQPFLYIIC